MTTPQGISASTVPVQPTGSTYLFTSTSVYPTLISNQDGNNTVYYGFGNGLSAGDITTTAPLAPGGSIAIQGELGDVYAVSAPGTVVNVAVVPGGTFFTVPPSVFKAGNTVIINQQGLFLFSGIPGPGTLVASISGTGGTIFGNTFFPYFNAYNPSGTATQLAPGGIFFNPTAAVLPGSVAGTFNQLALSSEIDTAGFNALQMILTSAASPSVTIGGDVNVNSVGSSLGKVTANGGVKLPNLITSPLAFASHFMVEQALSSIDYLVTSVGAGGLNQWYTDANGFILYNHPGSSNTPETWQNPSPAGFGPNGANQPFKYRITPENMLEMEGELVPAGAYVAGTTIFTLPSAYRPPAGTNRPITIVTAGGSTAGFIAIPSSGAVNIGSAMAAGNVAIIGCRIRLVA